MKIFCAYLCVCVVYANSDWSNYEVISDVDFLASAAIVKNIPIFRYWDSTKSKFRTGIVGEYIENRYPNLVSVVDRKIMTKENNLITEKLYVVDTNTIFMHMFAMVQKYAQTAVEMQSRLDSLLQEKMDIALKIIRIANETGSEWRTATEIRGSREVLESRVWTIQSRIDRLHSKSKRELNHILYKYKVS